MTQDQKKFESALIRVDAGDFIYSLLFCRILGTKVIYFDKNSEIKPYIKNDGMVNGPGKCTENTLNFLHPLIARQKDNFDNIERYTNQTYSYEYGEYHAKFPPIYGTNLTEWHARKFNINWMHLNTPWLLANKDEFFSERVIINKTQRYTKRNNNFYGKIISEFDEKCLFVGSEIDHKNFKEEYGFEIDFLKTDNSLEMATAINSCKMFVGNSSFCAAVAIGVGKHSYIELNDVNNYLFFNNYTKFFL